MSGVSSGDGSPKRTQNRTYASPPVATKHVGLAGLGATNRARPSSGEAPREAAMSSLEAHS